MIRAVIDVNVLLSAIIGPLRHSRQVALAWEAGRFGMICSAGIIAKLEEKLTLPRITGRFTLETPLAVQWVQALVTTQAERVLVPGPEQPPITGDPEDDYVLATGRLARADYLVTGDKALLQMGEYAGMQIVSPREFLEVLRSQGSSTR